MKIVSHIVATLLGLLFAVGGILFLLGKVPEQAPPPPGSPIAVFMGVLGSTGYMTFVKVCELIGGILVIIPRTRVWGLLILWPIIVNILAYWAFVARAVPNAPTFVVVLLALGLLICRRKAILGLLNHNQLPS